MEEIQRQRKIIEDRIEELQQQVRFCHNDYDFHHKNNEFEILQKQSDKLRESVVVYKVFNDRVKNMRKMLEQGHKKCNEVDNLLVDMGIKTGR